MGLQTIQRNYGFTHNSETMTNSDLELIAISSNQEKVKVLVPQACLTLCSPMECSPPGFSVRGILQVRILEWAAIPFSEGSSQPRDWTLAACTAGRFFTVWATGEAQELWRAFLNPALTFMPLGKEHNEGHILKQQGQGQGTQS